MIISEDNHHVFLRTVNILPLLGQRGRAVCQKYLTLTVRSIRLNTPLLSRQVLHSPVLHSFSSYQPDRADLFRLLYSILPAKLTASRELRIAPGFGHHARNSNSEKPYRFGETGNRPIPVRSSHLLLNPFELHMFADANTAGR